MGSATVRKSTMLTGVSVRPLRNRLLIENERKQQEMPTESGDMDTHANMHISSRPVRSMPMANRLT
ncbi:hypothetical protein ZHAS_00007843 [Anopheles sinensis]|uniref:Uncharacterized protein n=1 Tax=Anopheles sinensis TaxID=74873 RepID=A0A084VQV5_ANOSI|nr:hypothetical protein ZHAS_00007843 [Anopheles sinensis]